MRKHNSEMERELAKEEAEWYHDCAKEADERERELHKKERQLRSKGRNR